MLDLAQALVQPPAFLIGCELGSLGSQQHENFCKRGLLKLQHRDFVIIYSVFYFFIFSCVRR